MKRVLIPLLWMGLSLIATGQAIVTSPVHTPVYTQPATAFSPLSLSPALWLDASDAATVNTTTRVWSDKSGNARHASAAASEFPVISGNFMRFNGSNSYLSGSYPTGTTAATWFIVFNPNGDAGYYLFGTNNLGANYGWDRWQGDGRSYPDRFRNPRLETYGSVNFPTAGNTIVSGVSSSSTWEQYLNGTTQGAATAAYQSGTSYGIGTNINRPGGTQFGGDIGEIIIYPAALTTTQRQQIEGYLAWKWGTVSSLPAGHPYKNAAP